MDENVDGAQVTWMSHARGESVAKRVWLSINNNKANIYTGLPISFNKKGLLSKESCN